MVTLRYHLRGTLRYHLKGTLKPHLMVTFKLQRKGTPMLLVNKKAGSVAVEVELEWRWELVLAYSVVYCSEVR